MGEVTIAPKIVNACIKWRVKREKSWPALFCPFPIYTDPSPSILTLIHTPQLTPARLFTILARG